MLLNCLSVGLGGCLGSVFRYLVSQIPLFKGHPLPIGTLLVNVAGAFLIGLIIGISEKHDPVNEHLLLMMKVGLCGGFTTFSTFSAETLGLFEEGRNAMGALYILFSVSLCIAGVMLGKYAASRCR